MLKNQRGSGLLLVIMVFATLFALLGLSLDRSLTLYERIQKNHLEDVALNLAEAGIEYTLHQMMDSEKGFSGVENVALDTGRFSTSVSAPTPSGMVEILSTGIAEGKGRIPPVQKRLKVVLYIDPTNAETAPVVHSWQEVL